MQNPVSLTQPLIQPKGVPPGGLLYPLTYRGPKTNTHAD
jgi:hypothetical protein